MMQQMNVWKMKVNDAWVILWLNYCHMHVVENVACVSMSSADEEETLCQGI